MAVSSPDFTILSRYNELASVELVRFAANTTVLESELNESQQASNYKLRQMMAFAFNDGLSTLSSMAYSSGNFTVSACHAMVNGLLLYISSLTLAATSGDYIYLDTWTSTDAFGDVLRRYGNSQEATTVANYMKDPQIGAETSRRVIRKYSLSKTNGVAGHNYLLLGQIVTGSLVKKAPIITLKQQAFQKKTEELFTSTAGQTIFNLTLGTYVPGEGQMDVYLNGVRQPRSSFTETSSTRLTLKAGNIPAGIQVCLVYG